MNNIKQSTLIAYKIVAALLLTALFILPMGQSALNLITGSNDANLIFPFKLPFYNEAELQNSILHIFFFSIYLLPLVAVFLLISIFIKKNLNSLLYLLTYIASSFHLISSIITTIVFANCSRWFYCLHFTVYISLGLSFIFHAFMSIYAIQMMRERNPEFAEYGEAAPAMLVPLVITAIISIVLGLFPNAGLHLFDLAVMAGNQVFNPYM